MNYQRAYKKLISLARNRKLNCYFERHHIKPRSLGGGDSKRNVINLTYREHFLAHWLLTKIHKGLAKRKMQSALFQMCRPGRGKQRILSSWQYETAKRAVKNAMMGRKLSISTRRKISKSHLGKSTMSLAARKRMSKRFKGNSHNIGRKASKKTKEKMSAIRKGRSAWNKGIPHSKDHKRRISLGMIGNKNTKGRKLSKEHIAALRCGHRIYFNKNFEIK